MLQVVRFPVIYDLDGHNISIKHKTYPWERTLVFDACFTTKAAEESAQFLVPSSTAAESCKTLLYQNLLLKAAHQGSCDAA